MRPRPKRRPVPKMRPDAIFPSLQLYNAMLIMLQLADTPLVRITTSTCNAKGQLGHSITTNQHTTLIVTGQSAFYLAADIHT